jgi:hypothetical protein
MESQKGVGNEQTRRNSLALITRAHAAETTTLNFSMEIKMQTEIEILESRENPTIVWY